MHRLQRLIAALWFGSAVFLMLAASAAFRAAGNATVAADVVGSMLTRWHYIALAAPLALFALELRRVRPLLLILLFTSLILAAAQAFVDLRIRAIRATSVIPVSELDRRDPIRRTFGALHGLSMMLLALQAIAAAAAVVSKEKREESEKMSSWNPEQEDTTIYKVVMNHEEQYSIWPADRENAMGWNDVGFQGTKSECLAHIEKVWTDMRPLSLRRKMEEQGGPGGTDTSGGGP
jgi:MbtH protein